MNAVEVGAERTPVRVSPSAFLLVVNEVRRPQRFWPILTALLVALTLLPSAAQEKPARRPNILFCISDDQSWLHTGASGCRAVKTPAFDRVAREGVRFTQAFCPSPGCSPSRAAMLTGRYPWELEEAGTHASSFPRKLAVYPDLLEAAGYHVGSTGKGWGPGNWKVTGWPHNPAGREYNGITVQEVPARGISRVDYAANFQVFLKARPAGRPFCFWYGGHEPHRGYEKGSGLRSGKRLSDVDVPPFLPDHETVRGDLLDYCAEIEWFDQHLGRMLKALEEAGELDRTLVVVTADNGMSFPRAKANVYEYGFHAPLAIRWPERVPGNRVVDDLISGVDFAPTFLQAAGLETPSLMRGRSLLSLLASRKQGSVEPERQEVFTSRERHSSARFDNLGYPSRALRTREYLYIRNFNPERWPAGDPKSLGGAAGAGDEEGGADDGFFDIDAAPTKSLLLAQRDSPQIGRFFHLAVDRRPGEELYDVRKDPSCLDNLAGKAEHAAARDRLRARLDAYLTRTGDPRMGPNAEVWETYPRYSPIRRFPPPGG